MSDLFKKFEPEVTQFLDFLRDNLSKRKYLSSELSDAIIYSVFRGGKRIRPIFCFGISKSLGKKARDIFKFAGTIELIHNYSLVHDDLPEMDNDDYRRGLESTHKKYGNAIGLLSGDALLSLSCEIAMEDISGGDVLNKVKSYELLFKKSGATGMIDGQAFEEKLNSIEDYFNVITKKTANLFISAIVGSSIYLGASSKIVDKLNDFSIILGQTFQLLDDFIDHENDAFLARFDFNLKEQIENNRKSLYKILNLLDVDIETKYLRYIIDEMFSNKYLKNES